MNIRTENEAEKAPAKERKRKFKSLSRRLISQQMLVGGVILVVFTAIIYFGLFATVSSTAVERELTINKSVTSQINTVFSQLNTTANNIAMDGEIAEYIDALESSGTNVIDRSEYNTKLSICLSKYQNSISKGSVRPIVIHMGSGSIYQPLGEQTLNVYSFLRDSRYLEFKNGTESIFVFSTDLSESVNDDAIVYEGSNQIYFSFCVRCSIGGRAGIIVIVYDMYEISSATEQAFEENSYKLLGTDDRLMYPLENTEQVMTDEIYERLKKDFSYSNPGYCEENGNTYFMNKTRLGDVKILRCVSNVEKFKPFYNIFIFVAVFFVLIVAVLIVTSSFMIKRRMAPLSLLFERMVELANGKTNVRLDIKSGDEIETLAESYNTMVEKLGEYVEKLIENEDKEEKMRYSLMVSQLDPHFIYNTMHTITVLASKKRNDDIIVVNNALVKILKDTLRVTLGENIESIKHEIDMSEAYVTIQRYRYSDAFEVEWDVDESTLERKIPRNIIQPLIENAVFHGLMGGKKENILVTGGYIYVSIRDIADNRIEITVSDNGVGMSDDAIKAFEESNAVSDGNVHITLANIKYRLRHIYGESASIRIESGKDEGTNVIVSVPYNPVEKTREERITKYYVKYETPDIIPKRRRKK